MQAWGEHRAVPDVAVQWDRAGDITPSLLDIHSTATQGQQSCLWAERLSAWAGDRGGGTCLCLCAIGGLRSGPAQHCVFIKSCFQIKWTSAAVFSSELLVLRHQRHLRCFSIEKLTEKWVCGGFSACTAVMLLQGQDLQRRVYK